MSGVRSDTWLNRLLSTQDLVDAVVVAVAALDQQAEVVVVSP